MPSPERPAAPLSRLVQAACDGSGLSYRQLADRSVDPETGTQLDFRWVNSLAHDKLANSPAPARLRALAVGLGVPVEEIKRLAAAQWLDFHVEVDRPAPDEWVLWTQLNDDDKETLRILAQGLAEQRRATAISTTRHDSQ